MLKEFKNFILTGNVVDLAIGVIMAGAVGSVVNGFVTFIMMPIVGLLTGGIDFSKKTYELTAASTDAAGVVTPANVISYGSWITQIINLIIVGFVMFMIVKAYNKARGPVEAPAPAGPTDVELLTEIRDALRK